MKTKITKSINRKLLTRISTKQTFHKQWTNEQIHYTKGNVSPTNSRKFSKSTDSQAHSSAATYANIEPPLSRISHVTLNQANVKFDRCILPCQPRWPPALLAESSRSFFRIFFSIWREMRVSYSGSTVNRFCFRRLVRSAHSRFSLSMLTVKYVDLDGPLFTIAFDGHLLVYSKGDRDLWLFFSIDAKLERAYL